MKRHVKRGENMVFKRKLYDKMLRYEVYAGDNCFVLDEDGDVAEFKDTVYETEQFYCD